MSLGRSVWSAGADSGAAGRHSGVGSRQSRPGRKQKNRDKDFLQRNIEVQVLLSANDDDDSLC